MSDNVFIISDNSALTEDFSSTVLNCSGVIMLIVDNDAVKCKDYCNNFDFGLSSLVVCATSLDVAHTLILNFNFDIIFLDLLLDNKHYSDGLSLLFKLQATKGSAVGFTVVVSNLISSLQKMSHLSEALSNISFVIDPVTPDDIVSNEHIRNKIQTLITSLCLVKQNCIRGFDFVKRNGDDDGSDCKEDIDQGRFDISKCVRALVINIFLILFIVSSFFLCGEYLSHAAKAWYPELDAQWRALVSQIPTILLSLFVFRDLASRALAAILKKLI